jgi:hypothetical protein
MALPFHGEVPEGKVQFHQAFYIDSEKTSFLMSTALPREIYRDKENYILAHVTGIAGNKVVL